ncbi:16S rRNA (cytosine(1402)-N(4))-methyltransferase RsmH [Desulforhopalus singaporensis]|uniref:Ribosomal RNA small subunit methyltransferase H n=1 Tax=Desulforhopalus singaporensis TaxID=91360 RepID=A0A1H0UKM0_9BACT|nr:16S rRNA (cytosine(1402)-N(4))-methyltransferase RsmH [Desulforhopalus singaporensis]SDP66623.1 16S rRNA (cytosine1402-N4)-methyltransferase [Desulforhopalus singaporensis]
MTADSARKIHVSVLLDECMHYLDPQPGKTYVDGTLGLGGHTEAILDLSAPDGRVIAFDWDEKAIERAARRLEKYGKRLVIDRRNFADISTGLARMGVKDIDGLLLDVGLSSLQLDMGERGFSFQKEEYLDMRMDNRGETTAASIIARATEQQLADIFFYYGQERQARPIAAAIVAHRKKEKIETTGQLVSIVAGAVPKRFHPKKIHVATLVFQALRIAVNGELENLARILDEGVEFLRPGATFCVISFHSLEDGIVKRKFKSNKSLEILTQKPVVPSREEIANNPRARSARLRVARKCYEKK